MSKQNEFFNYDEVNMYAFRPTLVQYRLLKWLGAARGKGDKVMLQNFFVPPSENGLVLTTDGFRIHACAFGDSIPFDKPGYYQPILLNSKFCSFTRSEKDDGINVRRLLKLLKDYDHGIPVKKLPPDATLLPNLHVNGQFLSDAAEKSENTIISFCKPYIVLRMNNGGYYGDFAIRVALIMQRHSVDYIELEGGETANYDKADKVIERMMKGLLLDETLEAVEKESKEEDAG